jgi:phosphatidylglycerophosphate synthase
VPTVRTGPGIGLIAQVVLLVGIAGTTGLSPAGWLAGIAYGAGLCAVLTWGLHQCGKAGLGPADRVTLTRAVLVGGVVALTVDSLLPADPLDGPAPAGHGLTLLVGLVIVALALDGVDGYVARRTDTVSAFGARFDMEVDSVLLLVLSVYVARPTGGWALAIGAMRYAFVAAMWVLPWMRRSLPPRYWRKVVAATQGVVLVAATAGVFPRPVVSAALAVSLFLLVESFGRDVLWLWQRRPAVPQSRHAVLFGRHGRSALDPGLETRT